MSRAADIGLDFEQEWAAARERVLQVWAAEKESPASGRRASKQVVADISGIPKTWVERMLESEAPPNRPGRPEVLGAEEKKFLTKLLDEADTYTDEEYVIKLQQHTGTVCSRPSVNHFLKHELISRYVNIDYSSADKWTVKNLLRLRKFELMMAGVDRSRIRFYDQTGFTAKDFLPKKVRRRKGGPDTTKKGKTTKSNITLHTSVFGLTCLRTNQPALWTRFYSSSAQNGQGTSEHVQFFQQAVADGILERGDVVVLDNWSGHTSADGERLRSWLRESQGIVLVYLPAKFSHLNSIEHCWRTSKSWACRATRKHPGLDPRAYMQVGCESITHAEILRYMIHDGWGVEVATRTAVLQNSAFPERPSSKKRRMN